MESLETRRVARVDNFIRGTVNHQWFGPSWYPRRPEGAHDLRERRIFAENHYRTTRLFNNPRNFFVRRANGLGVG